MRLHILAVAMAMMSRDCICSEQCVIICTSGSLFSVSVCAVLLLAKSQHYKHHLYLLCERKFGFVTSKHYLAICYLKVAHLFLDIMVLQAGCNGVFCGMAYFSVWHHVHVYAFIM